MIVSYLHKQPENLNPDTKSDLESENRDNEIYFDFLTVFLKSLATTNPKEKIYLKLFNFSEQEIHHLNSLNKNLTIEKVTYDAKYLKNRNDLETVRHLSLLDLLIEQLQKHEKIIYMDVDILVRGNVQKIYDILDENDITIQTWKTSGKNCDYNTYDCDKAHDGMKLCGGLMAFKNEKALPFLREWRSLISSSNCDWWSVQVHLYSVYKKYTENNLISFFDLPQKFHDMQLTNDSIIWHGNISINRTKKDNLNAFIKDFNENMLTQK